MKYFIREFYNNTVLYNNKGWGNGYVIIPKEHALHGKHYDEINDYINVHGGLTFSDPASDLLGDWEEVDENDIEGWIIGFDTAHYGDTLEYWTKERVEEETKNLLKQIEDFKI